jgi:LmbE family N-acetylglucosaminyl deacetylase
MHQFALSHGPSRVRSILAIGCHSDDIEIGCGGTILAFTRANDDVHVTWVVLAATGTRKEEARTSAEAFLGSAASSDVRVHGFRDGFLPHIGGEVKEVFESTKREVSPDIVFTHTRDDLHQDHQLASDLARQTFRDHLILEFEIPKVDGDLGRPNVYIPLSASVATDKVALLEEHHPSQAAKHWFDADTFMGLMRLRGMECVAPERYAEAFVCHRLVVGV